MQPSDKTYFIIISVDDNKLAGERQDLVVVSYLARTSGQPIPTYLLLSSNIYLEPQRGKNIPTFSIFSGSMVWAQKVLILLTSEEESLPILHRLCMMII